MSTLYTVKIDDRNPLNVSDHTLLIAIIHGVIKGSQSSIGKKQIIKRPNWTRCDKEKYQEAIRESVTNIDTVNLDNASSEISKLVDLLQSAGKKSIPNYRETITDKDLPQETKEGVVSPVHKSGKDKLHPENYVVHGCLQICRLIQRLQKRVASAANYSVLGIKPNTVNCGPIATHFLLRHNSRQYQQRIHNYRKATYNVKTNANTFISRLEIALSKYKLPKAQELLLVKPTREKWKTTVKCAIQQYWAEKWEIEKSEKSTMKYINIKTRPIGNSHQILKFTSNNTLEVKKAEISAKLITRTYTLQVDRATFSRNVEQDMCLLCNSATEDTEHFMLECSALQTERDKHLTPLKSYVKNNVGNKIFEKNMDEGQMVQFILDSSSEKIKQISKYQRH
ncbi:Hypothetical predicted protein [Mytilus galloprovincialis]|uniref:Reverse transcriptase zinc-binding domain-containing protein n=1 Tax=Mytilus galloprovincialis TaxID=29158 RepID=A0A8B6DCZ9_MYTGA|nr:Hypothetical predicted protein [Mytilus galloprovincialis]